MGFKVIPKTAFPGWFDAMQAEHRIIAPTRARDAYRFTEVSRFEDVDLSYTQTILPPKKAIFPQRDELFSFRLDDREIIEKTESVPTILLGVHTCDLHAMKLLDTVYGGGFVDQHYMARREATTIISIECLSPCSEHSFCKSMGTLSVTNGFDLHLTEMDDSFAIDIGSEKGAALLADIDQLEDASDEYYSRLNKVLSDKWPRFPYQLELDITELANLLSVSYDSDLWEELGAKCLACGSCTAVCPTCTCFDVKDDVDYTLNQGVRFREWDHCPLLEFAVVAGGHNFRERNAARQRHRFFRKGKYQMEAHGLVGCVGCGRCAEACLVHISPVETFNELTRRRIPMSRRHLEIRT